MLDLTIMRCRKMLLNRQGAVMIIIAVAFVAIVGFCSLVVDIGNLLLTRQKLSNSVDAAALAGANIMGEKFAEANVKDYAIAAAEEYIRENEWEIVTAGHLGKAMAVAVSDTKKVELDISVSEDHREITVRGNTQVKHFLATVLGISESTVSAAATARVDPATSVTGVVPVGIPAETFDQPDFGFGKECVLKLPAQDGNQGGWRSFLGSGNCGLLDPGSTGQGSSRDIDEEERNGHGSDEWREDFINGYNKEISKGDLIATIQGNRNGPVKAAVEARLNQCTHSPKCSISRYENNCPRVIIVPVYEKGEEKGNHVINVRTVGFAKFLLIDYSEDLDEHGNIESSSIKGWFLEGSIEGDPDPTSSTISEYGTYVVYLSK